MVVDYIIYHEVKPGMACPDGIAAAWVASKAYSDAKIKGWVYQSEELPQVEKGDRLIIVDFSFPLSAFRKWSEMEVETVLIDHHKTAMEHLGSLLNHPGFRFDMNECGATLTWKHLFPDKPMPVFLEYVRDRDLWNFELEGTEEVHEAMAKIGRTFALFDRLAQMNRDELLACLKPIGEVLLKPKREAIAKAVERVQFGDVAGYKAIAHVVLNPDGSEDRLVSDICSALYKSYESLFVACLTSDGSWSLRSNKNGNNTDVGAIATQLGGGGHRNAAGFKVVPTNP